MKANLELRITPESYTMYAEALNMSALLTRLVTTVQVLRQMGRIDLVPEEVQRIASDADDVLKRAGAVLAVRP